MGNSDAVRYEESTTAAVAFTLVPSPISGGSGHVEVSGAVIIKCTGTISEECTGTTTRSRHCCNECYELSANKAQISTACGHRITLKLFDLITAMVFDPDEVCQNLSDT